MISVNAWLIELTMALKSNALSTFIEKLNSTFQWFRSINRNILKQQDTFGRHWHHVKQIKIAKMKYIVDGQVRVIEQEVSIIA